MGSLVRATRLRRTLSRADLLDDMAALVDHLRENFPGASPGTPFIDGGMLPYWVDAVNGTEGVMSAIYGLNTSRPCTGTADSRIFSDFFPGTKIPNGEPGHRSGITGVSPRDVRSPHHACSGKSLTDRSTSPGTVPALCSCLCVRM